MEKVPLSEWGCPEYQPCRNQTLANQEFTVRPLAPFLCICTAGPESRQFVGANPGSTESHKGHGIRWSHFLFPVLPCHWHLWGCNDVEFGARPGEKIFFMP